MADWQPIETAPIREAVLIHHKAHWTRLGCLLEDGSWRRWPSESDSDGLSYTPTHWARVPEEPANG